MYTKVSRDFVLSLILRLLCSQQIQIVYEKKTNISRESETNAITKENLNKPSDVFPVNYKITRISAIILFKI